MDRFKSELRQITWEDIYSETDPSKANNNFLQWYLHQPITVAFRLKELAVISSNMSPRSKV